MVRTPSRSSAASPSAARSGSGGAGAAMRGPLALSAETSYHKRLRGLLLDHKRYRKEWQELVMRGCVQRLRAVTELWVEIENGLAQIQKQRQHDSSSIKASYISAQTERMSAQLAVVSDCVDSLQQCLANMRLVADRAEALTIEASKTRGIPFAFKDPMWVTWALARFSDGLVSLTAHYAASFHLLRDLVDKLATFPPLAPDSDETKDKQRETAARPSNSEIQANMSLLALQPLLPGKNSSQGVEAFEELCAVEVGNWDVS